MTLRAPKILVVDDHPADLAAMRKLLGRLRCRVEVAQTGNAALAACVRDDFALIFLGVELPGMDGFEVAQYLKDEPSTRHIPIIFVSASDRDEAQRLRGYQLGAADYLVKPLADLLVLSKAGLFIDLHTSKRQLTLELARSESMRAAALEKEARLHQAIDCAPIPIMLHAEDGEVILVNRRWLELTGYARDEFPSVEAWIATLFGTGADAYAARARAAQLYDIAGVVHEGEFRVRTALGATLVWDCRSAPLAALPDGRRVVLSMAQDVTSHHASLRAATEATHVAESAERAKGEFLANMSHEIRTPLHVIVGLGHLLRREVGAPELQARLDQLCATSDHLLAVINDVLDLSKIEAQRLTLDHIDFRLDTVVENVMRIVEDAAKDKGLTLKTEIAPRLRDTTLKGDPLRLVQVLLNLCGNAVKFTDEGAVRLGIVCLAEYADSVALRFVVEDTGIGIAPADQARLFHAFEQADGATRERGGTGLGLAISQRLVALMGGAIVLDSRLAAGSTFSFELTLPRGDGVAEHPMPAAAKSNFAGTRVLVAEDHPINQEIILDLLEALGCEPEIAGDGAEALECARSTAYDLILMDVRMPRIDGFAATRAIRNLPHHRHTPILAVTAGAVGEDRRRCLDAGMNGYITKPFTRATLATGLRQWLPDRAAAGGDAPASDDALGRALDAIPNLDATCRFRRYANNQAAYIALLRRYVDMQEHDMERLREHLAAGDRGAACGVVHQLQGVSGFIGADRIAALASEIDAALRAGADADALAPLTASCAAELAGLAAAVRAMPKDAAD